MAGAVRDIVAAILKPPARALARCLWRVRVEGLEHYRAAGPRVLIVANHVSLLDGVLLYLFLPERPTFAINTLMASRWYFRPFLWFVDLFRLDPTNALSLKSLIQFLREDRKAIIFPEGRITTTGALMKIYDGPGLVADRAEAMVLPIGIEGAQYSRLSYLRGLVRRRLFPQVTLRIHPPRRIRIPERLQGHERRAAAAREMTRIMREVAYANLYRPQTLFQALLAAMRLHGPRTVVAEDAERNTLSYRQLVTRAFVLGGLMARRTRPGEHVGLMLPNSNAGLVAMLALHARGRVPALLNFTAGTHGLVTACETGVVRTVFTSRRFVDAAGLEATVAELDRHVRVVYLEDLRAEASLLRRLGGLVAGRMPRLAYRLAVRRPDPEATAVVLFTSGSEGVPKGVALSHRNLLANRAQARVLIDLTRRDIVFNCMPMFHAFGLLGGVVLPLLDAARIFFYPTPLHYRVIPELFYELQATVLFGTNTFLAGYARNAHPFDFHSARYVVAGAEKLKDETRRLWADKLGVRVLEGYGTTEASPVVAVNTPMGNKPGTVGQPLVHIDWYLEPVEGIAEGGRLVIRGPNVMKGYLYHGSDGQITPPMTDRGTGWYDTGDVVTVDEDDFITIVGRAKRFAKVGGEMISLAAVEELAAELWPEAMHGAIAVTDPRRGEQVVLATTAREADRRALVEHVKATRRSELLVPRHVLVLDELPQLGSGKVDYRTLAARVEQELTR